MTDHFEETGYTELGTELPDEKKNISPAYLSTWNDRAKRARKKYLASGATIRAVSTEEFIQAYRETKVP